MSFVKLDPLLLPTALFIAAFFLSAFIFPFEAFGSSVYYVSLSFLFLAYVLAFWNTGGEGALESLGLAPKKTEILRLLGLGVLLAIGCVILAMCVSAAFYFLGSLDTGPVLEKIESLPLPALIAAFTLAPLAEEALFRGFLFRFLSQKLSKAAKRWGWVAAAVAVSLIFSLMHVSYGSTAELAVAFAVGFALCLSVQKTGSIVPAIVAHALFNLASISSVFLFY